MTPENFMSVVYDDNIHPCSLVARRQRPTDDFDIFAADNLTPFHVSILADHVLQCIRSQFLATFARGPAIDVHR